MDNNEFTRRLEREGMKGIAAYLQTILKELRDIKEEVQALKKKQKPEEKTEEKPEEKAEEKSGEDKA